MHWSWLQVDSTAESGCRIRLFACLCPGAALKPVALSAIPGKLPQATTIRKEERRDDRRRDGIVDVIEE